MSDAVAAAWDGLWEEALSGPLYQAICKLGQGFAIACLGFWAFHLYKQLQDDGTMRPLVEIVFPLFVVVMLANNGSMMASATYAIRGVINNTNTDVLTAVGEGLKFEDTLSELANFSSTQARIQELRSRCDSVINNEALADCFETQEKTRKRR